MRKLSLFAAVLLLAGVTSAQSLGDLAKKEKERRAKVAGETKSITTADAEKYKTGPVTTGTVPAPPAAKDKESDDKAGAAKSAEGEKGKPKSDEPTDFQGRTESFWRQTLGDARARVKDLENESNVLVLRLNDLQNRFYREADGYRQQTIQRDINKTLYEQDQNKTNLAKARADVEDLEREGRKSGALPGWLRP